jgi:alpha/beta superfamily hydrolase
MNLLNVDVNHVTIKKNMHKHNVTCHKYDHKECKINFSKSLQQYNEIDEHEIIHLEKNHFYVNAFNFVIKSCFRFNHDIQ